MVFHISSASFHVITADEVAHLRPNICIDCPQQDAANDFVRPETI